MSASVHLRHSNISGMITDDGSEVEAVLIDISADLVFNVNSTSPTVTMDDFSVTVKRCGTTYTGCQGDQLPFDLQA